jgi:1-acyl-sn-glycerol-3-phosphate acyltransferase
MGALSHQAEAAGAAREPLLAPVERFVRLCTTALSFAFFGLGGLVFATIVFPLFFVFIWDKKKRAAIAQASVHGLWMVFINAMRLMGTTSYEIDKPEVLKSLHGTIVVSNHPSLLDVVYMMSFMSRTRAVVKAGVWKNPFMRGVVTAADYIPNLGDPERLIRDCSAALKDGANLVIFPEGSRTPEGMIQRPYQKGFARAALAAGAPIQLVTIDVSPPMLRKGEPWHTVPKRRGHWTIRVHEKIDVPAVYGKEPSAAAVRKLSGDVAARIEQLILEGPNNVDKAKA